MFGRWRAGPGGLGRALRRTVAAVLLAPLTVLAADPQITSFIDSPDPVPAGGLYDYSLRVDNNQADAALNTRLTVTVPSGATFVSATPAGANCTATNATTVVCNLGTVAGGGTDPRDVTLRWRALGPGPTTIAASSSLTADNDVNTGNNGQTALTTVISGGNLAIALTGSPSPVVGGARITYTLTASNSGPNASGDIVITNNLPPSVTFVSASGTGWACSHSAGVVTCSRPGPLASGASAPAITLIGQVTASGGTVTNSASIAPAAGGAGVADPDSSNNSATVDTPVQPGADVRIAAKSVTSTTPAGAGSNVTFRIQPRNAGPSVASNVVVSDPLPTGWTFLSASGTNWSCSNSGNTVSCSRASLPTTASDDITVVARAPDSAAVGATGTAYTNTASISTASNDPDSSNNSGSVSLTVLPEGADLRLFKTKTPNPVALGSTLVSTIAVSNQGPRTATGPLRVVELLQGETFVSASGTGWACDASAAPVIVCTHPNTGGLAFSFPLPILTITTTATSAGSVTNTACTGSSVPATVNPALALPPLEGDPRTANDCATTTSVSTSVQPDLAITKLTSTANGDKTLGTNEGTVTYTLLVSNVSATAQAATGIRISDTVPAFITGSTTFASITATPSGGSTAVFSCSNTAALVQCSQTGGQLLQGQSVSVAIVVNRPLREGSFTNTATVSNVNEGDPDSSNNSATDTVVITPIADVQMTGKTVTPTSVRAGEVATYVLSFRNNGPSAALGVTVTDTFSFPVGDSGVTVTQVSNSVSGGTCSIAAGAVLNPASPAFNCTIGTLANGQTETITLRVRPNYLAGNAARSFGNVARVATTSVESPTGGDNGNNEQSATLAVTPAEVDLLVNVTDRVGAVNLDPVPYVVSNSFLSYELNVTNSGPSFASGVRISQVMTPPSGRRVRFVCDVASFGSSTCNAPSLCSATNVTSASGAALPAFSCSVPAGDSSTGPAVGDLAVGVTKTVHLRFEALDQPVPTGDVFNISTTVASNEPDTQAANDNDAEPTTVRQRVDLRAFKTSSVANPAVRQPFNWLVRITNGGPGHSLQTDVTDTLPAEVQVTGPITWTRTLQPGSGTCTLTGQTVSCPLGQLDSGGEALITIPARITSYPAGGTLTNNATVDTDPSKTGGIDTPGGNNSASHTLPVQRTSLAGTVFQDLDRSGSNGGVPQAPGVEPRISGVSLTLTGTDAYGNPVSQTTTTDANGDYLFGDLSPSDANGYTITQTQPAGFQNGPVNPPASGAGAAAPGGSYAAGGSFGSSSWVTGRLDAGVAGTNYNFPELITTAITGTVYLDRDANGSRGANDGTLPGVTLRLVLGPNCSGTLVATTTTASTTDSSGNYGFSGLTAGQTYTVCETQPAPYGDGATNPGTGAASSTANAITISNLSVTGSSGNDFGEQAASLSGTVFLDANNDGVRQTGQAGEPGIAGVSLTLTGTDAAGNAVSRSTTTDSDGNYRFADLPASGTGGYSVAEQAAQPVVGGVATLNGRTTAGTVAGAPSGSASVVASLPSQISSITLPAGVASISNNFAEVLPVAISGTVFLDQDNNGVLNAPADAGIAGVALVITGTDDTGAAVSITTSTAADGTYSVTGLRSGTYTVTEPTQPAGTVNGITTAGSAGGTVSAVGSTPSSIGTIVLTTPGSSATGNNFAEVVPPSSPDLRVSKRLVGGRLTVGLPGSYVISLRNSGGTPSSGVYTVTDRLPTGITLAATPSGTGWACTGAVGASSFSCTRSSVLAAGATLADDITASVLASAAAAAASPLNNPVMVEGGGEDAAHGPAADERDAFNNNPAALPLCTATIDHNACRTPTLVQLAASVSGTVWYDIGSSARLLDSADRRLAGWQVEVVDTASNTVLGTTTTAADGSYRVANLPPGTTLVVRFRDPDSGVVVGYPVNGETAPGSSGATCSANALAQGKATSCTDVAAYPALTVTLKPGEDLPQQSLPVDPSGVVYDAVSRQPVPGAVVTLTPVGNCAGWNPATGVVAAGLGGYTVNGNAIAMTVGSNGLYQFLFTPTAPASCAFGLTVTPPAGYVAPSQLIPAEPGPLVPGGAAGSTVAVQPQPTAPTAAAGAATRYFLLVTTGSGGASVVHNHIPLDPAAPGAIALFKTGDKAVADVGDSVRYSITVSVPSGALPRQTTVVDRLPAGFSYIPGTAMVGDQRIADPTGGLGPTLAFNLGPMPASRQLVLRYRVRLGVGAQQGDGINRARAHACAQATGCVDGSFQPLAGSVATNESTYRVRVGGGVFGADACVLGKVFIDCNNNHVQDPEELGIPGVRLFMQDGTTLVSDSEGKYSMCGLPPRSAVLKVDPITLPRGARLTTSSNRNLGDAGSLWLDLKTGELHRADFVEGSCSNTVLEQTKARRAQGEVRAPETERKTGPALRFDSKAHGLTTFSSPQQGTDGANQQAPKPRRPVPAPAPNQPSQDDSHVPTPALPMNQPPPAGRDSGTPPTTGGQDGAR